MRNKYRSAQELVEEEMDKPDVHGDAFSQPVEEDVEGDKSKLPYLVRAAVVATSDIMSQFELPLPPELTYQRTRNVKYSKVYPEDVVSGVIILNCKIATIGNAKRKFEVAVPVVRGEIVSPSVINYNGSMHVFAQSTIDEIVDRATSYELPQIRGLYSPPMSQYEREMFIAMRNELGWQPRDIGTMEKHPIKRYAKGIPPAYGAVVGMMEQAEKDGLDTFPRAWQHILQTYILNCTNTASRDAWEVHLINGGWAINPWGDIRRRKSKQAQATWDGDWEPPEVTLETVLVDAKLALANADIEATEEEILEVIEIINNTPEGERAAAKHLSKVWILYDDDIDTALGIIAEAAHNALDFYPLDAKSSQFEGELEEEIEEVVEEVIQKMYNGTNLPIEVNDNTKFHTKDGPIKGKIVEVNPDDNWVIITSKGIDYRVHCEDIEPLNSTYKNKWAKEKKMRMQGISKSGIARIAKSLKRKKAQETDIWEQIGRLDAIIDAEGEESILTDIGEYLEAIEVERDSDGGIWYKKEEDPDSPVEYDPEDWEELTGFEFEDVLEHLASLYPESADAWSEPSEGDYIIGPEGVSIAGGGFLGDPLEWEDIVRLIYEDMEKNQYFPNVWHLSDHGNIELASNFREETMRLGL
jgi:hypothetical protein